MAALRLALVAACAAWLGVPAVAAADPAEMTRDEIIRLAVSGVGYSYWWGNGCWRTDGTQHGSCSGSCPSCTHTGSYGADCSGFAAKVWQVPSPSPVSTCAHPYSTWHFTCTETWWTAIARGSLQKGDCASYRVDGCPGSGGHIVVWERGDPWGSMWTYEARGCSYGIVHNSRTLSSSYRAIRRARLTSGCVPAAEVCNGDDDDCDGSTDEGDVCLLDEEVLQQAAQYDGGGHSDIDGDGRADVCGRAAAGWRCHASTGTGFGDEIAGPALSDASGWADVTNYSTIRMGDIDGDGLADVCARANAAFYCWKSTGAGFSAAIEGPPLSDASGWSAEPYLTTIRLADFNGDGRDDLCARAAAGWRCYPSTGDGFAAAATTDQMSDDAGWAHPEHYGTIRMGDVNGDGRADVCARANARVYCWLSDGAGFPARIDGPELSDDGSWDEPRYFRTIRVGDADGDGRDDLCARGYARVYCWLSDGAGFPTRIDGPAWGDPQNWDEIQYYATIRFGGPPPPVCRPADEVCDGADNDCDGEVDEGCNAEADAGETEDALRHDIGRLEITPLEGTGDAPGEVPVVYVYEEGGCGCAAPGARRPGPLAAWVALLGLVGTLGRLLRRRAGPRRGGPTGR
ncbi:MAG: VCBS repeat-containing protein [Myxococcales bacterium]|nr:VCBS repeat-containing protein [Myxococcales bacterium]